MKNLFCLLTLVILLGCRKETAEKPPLVKSVTYLREHFDTNNRLVRIDTSIHWCRVAGADLTRFEELEKTSPRGYVCGTYPEIWLRLTVTPACPAVIDHNKNFKK